MNSSQISYSWVNFSFAGRLVKFDLETEDRRIDRLQLIGSVVRTFIKIWSNSLFGASESAIPVIALSIFRFFINVSVFDFRRSIS